MATLKIKLENGFFVGTTGCYVSTVEATHVVANGWDCSVRKNGVVECFSARSYSDGEHSMRYVIQPTGFAKLTLKVPHEPVKTLRKGFVVPKGTRLSDGLIGLAGGNIDNRYAYFRDGSFQKFLEDHGISAVKHEDPNQIFSIRNARYGGGECSSYLLTDGNISEERYDSGRTERWEESSAGTTSAYEGNEYLKVTGASWAIHKQSQHEGDSHNCFRILYTLEKDLTKLVGIPNIREKEEKISQLKEVGCKGFLSLEELEKSLREIVPNLKGKKECKDPDFVQVTNVYYHLDNMLETSTGSLINFSSSAEAKKALEETRGIKFENSEMLEKYLHEHGFESAGVTRYYAYVSTNEKKTYVSIEMRPSTTKANGFNGFYRDFWTTEI